MHCRLFLESVISQLRYPLDDDFFSTSMGSQTFDFYSSFTRNRFSWNGHVLFCSFCLLLQNLMKAGRHAMYREKRKANSKESLYWIERKEPVEFTAKSKEDLKWILVWKRDLPSSHVPPFHSFHSHLMFNAIRTKKSEKEEEGISRERRREHGLECKVTKEATDLLVCFQH